MTARELETLRALVHLAFKHRHDPARSRYQAALIVDWWLFGRFAGRLRRELSR